MTAVPWRRPACQFQSISPSSLLIHLLDNLQSLHSPFDSLIWKSNKQNDTDWSSFSGSKCWRIHVPLKTLLFVPNVSLCQDFTWNHQHHVKLSNILKKESINTKLPPPHHTRIERCFLLGDLKQESVRKNFQNNAFSRRYLDTHDSI